MDPPYPAEVARFHAALERIPGVEGVEPRRFSTGTVELAVRTAQPPRALVEAIGRVGATYAWKAREADGGVVVEAAMDAVDPTTPADGQP